MQYQWGIQENLNAFGFKESSMLVSSEYLLFYEVD